MNAAHAAPSPPRVPFYHTIRGRLLLLALVVIAPLLLFVAFNILESVEDKRTDALRDTLTLAQTVTARIDDHVQNIDSLLLAVRAMVGPDLDAVDANDAKLRALQAGLPDYFRSISVLTPDGRMLNSSTVSRAERAELNFGDRSYFQEALAQRRLVFDEPVISRASGKWIVIGARPLLSADGSVRAVISMSTLLERFQTLLTPEGLRPGSLMTVLSQQCAVLARSIDPEKWVGKNLAKSVHFQRALAEREFSAETVASDGITRIAAYTTAGRVPWIVYVGIPSSVGLKQAQADLARLSALALVFLAAAAALAYWLARNLSRPIEAVAAAARLAATGKLDLRIAPEGAAEIRIVAEQFNTMLESLDGAERALRENEARLRLAMIAGRMGLQEWNHATRALYISPEWKHMLGYDDHNVASTPQAWQELVHPEDDSRVRAEMEAYFTDLRPGREIEFRLRHSDGHYRWVLARADPIRDAEGRPQQSIACFVDITERKQAEAALRESEERFRQLAENIRDAFWLTDPAKNTMLYISPAYESIWARSRDSLYASPQSWLDAIHPEDRGRVLNAALHKQTAGTYDEEYRVVRPDGTLRWIHDQAFPVLNAAGEIYRVAGVAEDITVRRRAQELLRESEAKLRSVIDGLGPYNFVGLMTPDGIIIEANQPALAAAGLEREDVLGKPVEQSYWFAHSRPVQQQLRAAVERAASGTPSRFDVEARVAEGQLIWLDFSIQPLRDETGRIANLVPSAVVITERKRAEEALREHAERLQLLSRKVIETQETERASIARELHDQTGQHLSALKLNLQVLRRNPEVRPVAPQFDESIEIVDNIVQQVRTLSYDLRPAQLDDLGLASALRTHAGRIAGAAGLRLHFAAQELPEPPAHSSITCFRIAQEALTNIVRHAEANNVWIDLFCENGQLQLAIRDDGKGCDMAVMRERALRGESMGMLNMEERTAIAGGAIDFNSAPGKGMAVRAMFPMSPPEGMNDERLTFPVRPERTSETRKSRDGRVTFVSRLRCTTLDTNGERGTVDRCRRSKPTVDGDRRREEATIRQSPGDCRGPAGYVIDAGKEIPYDKDFPYIEIIAHDHQQTDDQGANHHPAARPRRLAPGSRRPTGV